MGGWVDDRYQCLLAPPRELVPCRRSVDDDDRQEDATVEVPHEDGAEEEDDEVGEQVMVLLREAVDDANDSDQDEWNNHGEVDEVKVVVLEVPPVEEGKPYDGQDD